MIIYLLTNLVNNKRYIGQTTETLEKRFKRHCSPDNHNKDMAIVRSIQKYGKENFSKEIIWRGSSLNELNQKEQELIKVFDCLVPKGYNLDSGGKNHKKHESTKEKISNALKGKPKTQEHVRKVTESRQQTYLEHPELKANLGGNNRGKTFEENFRKKLSFSKDKSSKYAGVIAIKKSKNIYWRAECYLKGKRLSAVFNNEDEAAHCYDMFLIKSGLNPINFPNDIWTEQHLNSIKRKKTRISKYYGVNIKGEGYIQALVWFNGKKVYLGTFNNELDAHYAIKEFYFSKGVTDKVLVKSD